MADARFDRLREALLRSGVAARNVRRALLEIESHFLQLIEEAHARGCNDRDARIEAHELLGSNHTLVQRFAAQPALLAWSRRWPAIWFTLLPMITYAAVSAATLLAVLASARHMSPYLHRVHVAASVTDEIDLAARIALLWLFPSCVAIAFATLAYRRRVALRFPLIGIVAMSALASLCNVVVRFTGGPAPGEVGAGIGLSAASLPGQLMRGAVLAALALVPLWIALRRAYRDGSVN
jgi:hypothetical protein